MDYRAFLLLLLFDFITPFSSGKPLGRCTSQGGRFPPFSSEGKLPKRVSKGPNDLTLCRIFRKNTCCDVAQTHPALLTIRKLASTGEASQECLELWELMECSICDPNVGVRPGPPHICASLCDRVFQACTNAYLSMDAKTQVLAPCGVNDLVCGRASEWVSNGTDLCRAAGFFVKPYEMNNIGMKEMSCYGGQASLDSISDSWRSHRTVIPKNMPFKHKREIFEDFLQWTKDMPFKHKVSWAVGGMVLTAGLLFVSKRKGHTQRQKLAAIQRAAIARRMEAKTNPRSPRSPSNRKAF